MARPSSSSQRSLTLTEELEKLEQSITLTLQEIDHNFNRAHRIVTSSILPVVEQYAEHSRDVWEGSRFWKQFFEASANVSLNGYEEGQDAEDQTVTRTEDELLSEASPSNRTASSYMETPRDQGGIEHSQGPGSSPPGTATPRAAQAMGSYNSPYEALRRQHRPQARSPSPTPSSPVPSTPRGQTVQLDDDTFDSATPALPNMPTASRKTPTNNDILLHRILDRNYRIQATPLSRTAQRVPPPHSTIRKEARYETPAKTGAFDIDLDSSPMEEAPQLRADLFHSPSKRRRDSSKADWNKVHTQERVPGVSVLSPAKARPSSTRISGASAGVLTTSQGNAWDSDSDEDIFENMSPPKTMQFHVPTSKLMKTPAQEASKRIVEDLMTAGGLENVTDELDSPSIVRKDYNLEDDTF